MSVVGILGELTFDVKKMMWDAMDMKRDTIRKIINDVTCPFVDPSTFDWDSIDKNTWFICVNLETSKGYYFPICESENRDNNYSRVKQGMKYFISQGWDVYKIQ